MGALIYTDACMGDSNVTSMTTTAHAHLQYTNVGTFEVDCHVVVDPDRMWTAL